MNEILICQSCSMPLENEEYMGTNNDNTKNNDYCIYCFKDGKFNDDMTLEEFSEYSLQFAEQAGMTVDEMKEHCKNVLPNLKRWKQD